MSLSQSFDLPVVGDTTLPWFDADWPWNGTRVQRFIDANTLIPGDKPKFIDIDFAVVSPVAMFAGKDGDYWDDCTTQMLMVRNNGSWQIATRAPLRSELLRRFDKDEVEYVWEKQRPFPVVFNLGLEGLFGKTAFTYWNDDDNECVVRFDGDQTLRQVADSLAGWGVVSSRQWPLICDQFPQLASCESYLEDLGLLWPSGAHPLHQNKQAEKQTVALESKPDQLKVLVDGLDRSKGEFVWCGGRYEWLTETMMDALELLFNAFGENRRVGCAEMESVIGPISMDGFKRIFKVNRPGYPLVHSVAGIVGGTKRHGWYLKSNNS